MTSPSTPTRESQDPSAPEGMRFHTRKWVKPEDLNPNGSLFGGRLLAWIDEEAAIYVICQLDNLRVVTKYISEINFVSSARQGDVVELGFTATAFGRTSVTLRCIARNKITRKVILSVDKMVFVGLDEQGLPHPHGKTHVTYGADWHDVAAPAEVAPGLPLAYSLSDPTDFSATRAPQSPLRAIMGADLAQAAA
jgi:acyl-CoA hydrolase